MRLDKAVMERFGLSRRAAMEAVRNGKVDVDGRCCLEPGQDVAPEAPLTYDPNRPGPGSTDRHLRVLLRGRAHPDRRQARGTAHPAHPGARAGHPARAGRPLPLEEARDPEPVRRDRAPARPGHLRGDPAGDGRRGRCGRSRRCSATTRSSAVYLAVVEGVFLTPSGRIDLPLVPDRGDGRRGVARGPSPAGPPRP